MCGIRVAVEDAESKRRAVRVDLRLAWEGISGEEGHSLDDSVVWCGGVWCGGVWRGMVWWCMLWCGMVWYGVV